MPSITFIVSLNRGQLLPDVGEQNDIKVVVQWLESGDTALVGVRVCSSSCFQIALGNPD